jgi:hypothetical protein
MLESALLRPLLMEDELLLRAVPGAVPELARLEAALEFVLRELSVDLFGERARAFLAAPSAPDCFDAAFCARICCSAAGSLEFAVTAPFETFSASLPSNCSLPGTCTEELSLGFGLFVEPAGLFGLCSFL